MNHNESSNQLKSSSTLSSSSSTSSNLNNQSNLISNSSSSYLSILNPSLIYQIKNKNLTVVPIDKEAPSIDNWYHGKLDRFKAEHILKDLNRPGAFLVRESERKHGSYVLSYFSLNSNIHHFKITSVFGDYYIGGRQFDRLETLISYYMYYSELVKGEKLLEPVQPERVYKLEQIYVSIKSFNNKKPKQDKSLINNNNNSLDSNYWTNSDDDILYIDKPGELFRVYHEIGEGEWLWAQSVNTSEFGLLKSDCVKHVNEDKLHELEPWFYSNITKEEAVTILADAGNCSYLIRPSDQSPGDYTLFFNADNIVHRFRITGCINRTENIFKIEKFYHIGGRDFASITSIIERYMNEDITEGYRLTKTPHKRPDNYKQPFSILQELLLKEKTSNYLKMSTDINKENKILSNSNINNNNNSNNNNNIIINNNKLDIIKRNSFIFDDTNSKKNNENYTNLSISLNESSLKSVISSSSSSSTSNIKSHNQFKLQTSIDTNLNKKKHNSIIKPNETMSKSLSSPLTFDSPRTKLESLIKTSSSSSSSSNKSNEVSHSNSSNNSNQDNLLNKKLDKIVLKGYLNKYNEKSKKWKPYWFSLNQHDQQLFYFSDEKKIKEKGLIDLSFGFYYPIDDSFFNKSYCFQIIIHSLGSNNSNSSIVHYLCAENLNSFKEWTENIRPLCNPIQFNPFVTKTFSSTSSSSLSLSSSSSTSSPSNLSISNHNQNYRILRTLNLEIHEARNVCFSPQFQSNTSNNNSQMNNGQILNSQFNCNNNNNSNLPKYHKDNLYYCLIMFNNEAFVASTRLTTCSNLSQNSQSNIPNGNYDRNFNISSNSASNQNQNETNNTNSCKDSIWDDSFSFDNLPLDVKELSIRLFVIAKPTNFSASFVNNIKKLNHPNKMMDPVQIGYVNIRLDDLMNKGLFEPWYVIEPTVNLNNNEQGSNQPNQTECSIRLKIRFCEEKIYLNKNYYKELSDFLLNENEHRNLSILYEQIIPSTERPHFVQALLKFYIVKNKLIEMLKSFLLAEIDRCSDLSTLFRPASCSTSLMDHYMRIRCLDFLKKCIEEPLIRIFRNQNHTQTSFELDPSKCSDQAQREQNLFNFQVALKDLINSICNQNSVNLFPNELKHLFHLIRQHVHLKWLKQQNSTGATDDKLVKIYCVSAFVFLRLICPSMLNPKNFGLKFFINTNSSNSINSQKTLLNKNNNEFNYYELAQQFSVFSPNFLFTLCPSYNLYQNLNTQTSSNVSLFQQTNSTHQINCFNVGSFLVNSSSGSNSNSTSSNSIQSTHVYERHIKLLAKVLQTLANMTECKEPFMLPLSEFLSSNKPNIIKFIEDISNLSQFNINSNFEFQTDLDVDFDIKTEFENASCKYLAILNRLLNSLIPQMKLYIKKIDECLSKENLGQQEEKDSIINENEIQFSKSLKNLINILNDINESNSTNKAK